MDRPSHGALERLPAGLRRRVFAAEPAGLSRARYEVSLWAVLLLGASLAVQIISTALVALGPLAEAPPAEALTIVGRMVVVPSLDIPVFAAGCAAALLLMALLVRGWSLRMNRADLGDPPRAARRGAALHLGLAAASLLAYFAVVAALRGSLDPGPLAPGPLALLAAPTGGALLAIALYYAHWLRKPDAKARA